MISARSGRTGALPVEQGRAPVDCQCRRTSAARPRNGAARGRQIGRIRFIPCAAAVAWQRWGAGGRWSGGAPAGWSGSMTPDRHRPKSNCRACAPALRGSFCKAFGQGADLRTRRQRPGLRQQAPLPARPPGAATGHDSPIRLPAVSRPPALSGRTAAGLPEATAAARAAQAFFHVASRGAGGSARIQPDRVERQDAGPRGRQAGGRIVAEGRHSMEQKATGIPPRIGGAAAGTPRWTGRAGLAGRAA